ncbi:unnamed protein product [Mytilus coruscus]|uniref:Novel STAND NTPase 3 domain-containing protein n=1 Tax=Mytilus coruscus TaxID=42192 RepID=A0A6J7ZYR2_MYTCO|nr:unnamed protein product [Mytilus coruscus]
MGTFSVKVMDLYRKMSKYGIHQKDNMHAQSNPELPLYNNEISKWKQEDSKFVSTNQSVKILKYFDTEAILTITGNSGVGNSFTTKHVALHMLSKGYDVLPVRKPFDILKLQIFQSKEFESLQLLRKCQMHLLISDFTISEKRLIASKYISEEVLKELSDECIQAYDCFPLLCRMSKTWEASKALTFLLNPLSVFENELKQMKSREKLNLCALLLVTIFNNNFDNGLLTDDIDISNRNTLDNILEECGETRGTSRKLIKDHLDTMIGVYLMFEENSYRFANERLFEMTFTFMAKIFLKCMIKHCVVSMLCDKFGLECLDEGRQHYHFFVPSHFENFFYERLLKETDTYNFLDIFDCKQMNDKKYRAPFLAL